MEERLTSLAPISQTTPDDQGALPLTIASQALLREGSDRAFRQFVHGLLAFTARLHAIRNGFAELIGLTGAQYTILISVAHLEKDDEVGISAIAEHLHLSGAFVTIETNRLIKKGLLRKEASARDGRRVRLSVTADGRRLLARLAPHQAEVNDTLFAAMTGRDLERMLDVLPDLIDGADAASDKLAVALAAQAREARR